MFSAGRFDHRLVSYPISSFFLRTLLLVFVVFIVHISIGFAEILNGRILEINKKHKFVVINLGEKDRIRKGAELLVYRDKKLIGKIEVEEIFEKMSSCKILPWFAEEEIKIDDGVLKP